jgi:hypothetical protein
LRGRTLDRGDDHAIKTAIRSTGPPKSTLRASRNNNGPARNRLNDASQLSHSTVINKICNLLCVQKNAAGMRRAELKDGGSALLGCYLSIRAIVRDDFVPYVFVFFVILEGEMLEHQS